MTERWRDIGGPVGLFPTGERNAITDVPGVLVGHAQAERDGARQTREGGRRQRESGNAEALQLDRVAHTARREGPSISL